MQGLNWGYRLLFVYVKWMYTKCYVRTFEVHGTNNVPRKGPIIFVTNHQNNLPDALSILFASPIPPLFVARADLFKKSWVNKVLRFMRILPIHRADHGRDAIREDLPDTMNGLLEELNKGGACTVMGEGSSKPERSIRPLKKSWARLAEMCQQQGKEVLVIPVVMEYSNWQDWGPDVRVRFGEPIQIDIAEDTPARRVKALTDEAQKVLTEMVASDAQIATWEASVSQRRNVRDRIWNGLGTLLLPLAKVILFPVWTAARIKVRNHSRHDFKSTLEVGIYGLGIPVWILFIVTLLHLFISWKLALTALLISPIFMWATARAFVAKMHH